MTFADTLRKIGVDEAARKEIEFRARQETARKLKITNECATIENCLKKQLAMTAKDSRTYDYGTSTLSPETIDYLIAYVKDLGCNGAKAEVKHTTGGFGSFDDDDRHEERMYPVYRISW